MRAATIDPPCRVVLKSRHNNADKKIATAGTVRS
jgi:hypothetical protein